MGEGGGGEKKGTNNVTTEKLIKTTHVIAKE